MSRNQKIIFFLILALGVFLIFFRLGRQDMLSDEPLYALRALHYFDYLGSERQTTPVQWFSQRPAWSYLSFHDHPPIYDLVQFGLFRLFGDSITVVRLTSAFAAAGSLIVIFFLGRRFGSNTTGLYSMGALLLNNYFIWLGRIGLLEGLMIFWTLLGLLFLVKGLQEQPRNFLFAGLFFGAAVMTKYTVLLMLPAVLVFLAIYRRRVFLEKKFWLGVLLFFVAVSPVIFYNFKLYEARGHFDALFADLFGQTTSDWAILQDRVGGWRFGPWAVLKSLASGLSWPYLIVSFASLPGIAVLLKRENKPLLWLPLLIIAFLFLSFSYLGGVNRWVAVLGVMFALPSAVIVERIRAPFLRACAGVLAVYFLLFIFNTNHAIAAPANQWFTSPERIENLGYNQLERKLETLLRNRRPDPAVAEAVTVSWYADLQRSAIDFPALHRPDREIFPYLIVYDDGLQYFPTAWFFERRKLYERFFIARSEEFLVYRSDPELRAILDSLPKNLGVYFIKAPATASKSAEESEEAKDMVRQFQNQGIAPEIVYNDKGQAAFYLYDGLKR